MMAKHFMRPEDNVIRTTDLPEREQTYRGADPANMDYKAMSLYVHTPLSISTNCVLSAVMIKHWNSHSLTPCCGYCRS